MLSAMVLAGMVMACGVTDSDLLPEDSAAVDSTMAAPTIPGAAPGVTDCSSAPTWESFGQGFLLARCQSCHAGAAARRYGAPESITFDTEQEALLYMDRIQARVVQADPPTMPPSGGITANDRTRLAQWAACASR